MASIKKYDEEKKQWKSYSATHASQIELLDLTNSFNSNNVEGALRELTQKNETIQGNIGATNQAIKSHTDLLYEHETAIEWLKANGGGGGGGSHAPVITSTFETGTIVKKDQDVIIPIFFSSPNLGDGLAYIVIDGIEVKTQNVKQGNNKVDVGKMPNLRNEVAIYVKDRVNVLSNQLDWLVIAGGIDFTLNFDYEADYNVTDPIGMEFFITSASSEPIVMHLTVDYDEYKVDCQQGRNEYVFKELSVGIHKIKMHVTSGPYSTPETIFNIVVVNSNSLYLSTTFEGGTFEYGQPIPINYRISKASSETFSISLLLDNEIVKSLKAGVGSYYWTLNDAKVGVHTIEVQVNSDYEEQANFKRSITIVQGEYTPVKITESGLIYRLNAANRTNNDLDRVIPIDDSGNGIKAVLHKFNYFTNGWIDGKLICDGDAYVEIDCYPWSSNAIYGSTIEIQYKALDIGFDDSRILDYTDIEVPYKGAYVDLNDCTVKSLANTGTVFLNQDDWITVSFVIDRKNKFCKVYINGICSRAFYLSDTGSGVNVTKEDFTHNQKLYLNSRKGKDKFGACEIKDVRIYDRSLTDDEILKNYIAQEKNIVLQKQLYQFNYENVTTPVIKMYGDTSNMTLETPVNLRIKYTSSNEELYGQSFDLPYCEVNWQGTSSLQYVLKNYTIRLKDENMAPFAYTPFKNGILETVFCLKCDYMESTHCRNVGLAKFINESVYDTKNPAQIIDSKYRNAIDGFPILLYINDALQGIYNFNLDRYSTRSYGYETSSKTLVYEVSANSDTTAGAFHKWTPESGKDEISYYKSDFEAIYPPTRVAGNDNYAEIIRLVNWVNDSSDEDFRDNFERYFNLEYVIRYYLTVLVIGAVDNLGKNMKLTSFDGLVWWPQFYDLDTTIGLDNTGFLKFDMSIEIGDEGVFNTTGSILWQRIKLLFENGIKEQYGLMRQGRFTVENIMKYLYGEQISKIPERYYNWDMQTKYLNYKSSYLYALHGSSYQHIKKWIRDRLIYVDTLIGYTNSTADYITVRSSKLGKVYLDIQTYIPMYFRIKWRDEANNTGVQIKRIARGETVRFEYNMPTATDQEIIIYGGYYLKSIGDVSNLQPTTMLIANATRLTEITCHSPNLINTDLNVCTKLQRIDLSNSPSLGTGIGAQPILNIQQCNYLKYINVYNTSITAVYTMQAGGNLEEMYLSDTVQTIVVTNQTFLRVLGIPYNKSANIEARSLTTVQIENCKNIETIQYPYTSGEPILFKALKYVQNLTIKNSIDKLTQMSFSGFDRLRTVEISSMPNLISLGFDDMLKITDVSTLKTIKLGDCPLIDSITFNVSSDQYKVAFAKKSTLDISGLQSARAITCNYSIKGLDTLIIPTSLQNLIFSTQYGDGINEIKNIWSGSSNHFNDGFTGLDFKDMTINYIDMAGLSQITNAINFNITPKEQNPNMNLNRDGSQAKPWFRPEGVIDLTHYTGEMSYMFKGIDLNKLEIKLEINKIQTDLTGLFEGTTGVNNNMLKINKILSFFASANNYDKVFKRSDITDASGVIFNNTRHSLIEGFMNSKLLTDFSLHPKVTNVTRCFSQCNEMVTLTNNWENEYIYEIVATDCYASCNKLDLDDVPRAWGGHGFEKIYTTIYVIDTQYLTDMIYKFNKDERYSAPFRSSGYRMTNWGDGTIDENKEHTYKVSGTYIIKTHLRHNGDNLQPTGTTQAVIAVKQMCQASELTWQFGFSRFINLKEFDVDAFSCGNGNLTGMFLQCANLQFIKFNKIINYPSSLSETFRGCKSLKDINFITKFDLSKLTNMNGTFWATGIIDFPTIEQSLPLLKTTSRLVQQCNQLEAFGYIDTSQVTQFGGNGAGMFQNTTMLRDTIILDMSSLIKKDISGVFTNTENIDHIKLLKMPSGRYVKGYNFGYGNHSSFIYNCKKLKTITGLNLEEVDTTDVYRNTDWYPGMVIADCAMLTDIYFVDNTIIEIDDTSTSRTPCRTISFMNCPKLNHSTLIDIINRLKDYSGFTERKLNIGSTNMNKLTTQEIAIATNKNWTIY